MICAESQLELPCNRVYVNTGDPIEAKNLMEFRLLYEGYLPSTGNESHPKDVHAIRRVLHPQLRRLWQVRPNLRRFADSAYSNSIDKRPKPDVPHTPDERFQIGIREIGENWRGSDFDWVPLVVPEFALQCSLDILLLRPENYELFNGWADIDGQVKTIFDALQKPRSVAEAGGAKPDEGEYPFFCLIENDKLISEVKITADKLLMLPELPESEQRKRDEAIGVFNLMFQDADCKFSADEKSAFELARSVLRRHGQTGVNDAFVVIHVRLNHRDARTWDNYF